MVKDIVGTFGESDNLILEFTILWAERTGSNLISVLNCERADFSKLKEKNRSNSMIVNPEEKTTVQEDWKIGKLR